MRILFWIIIYVCTLGIFDIYVRYVDGLEIDFKSLWFKNQPPESKGE